MITWALPGPLLPFDGIEQPLPTDGKDVSLVAVVLFAVHGIALTADQLELQFRNQRRAKVAAAQVGSDLDMSRFYQCLDECLSIEGFKITGVPVEPMPQSDLLVDAEHQVLATVRSGRHVAIGKPIADGNYTHYLIGDDLGFPGGDVLVEDSYFDDEPTVFNDTRPTIAKAWRDLRLTPASTQVVLEHFRSDQLFVASRALAAQSTSRRKPGPQSDKAYIEEHAKKVLPDGRIPAGMTKQEARRQIEASMRASKGDGQNRRVPNPKTFQRHGY